MVTIECVAFLGGEPNIRPKVLTTGGAVFAWDNAKGWYQMVGADGGTPMRFWRILWLWNWWGVRSWWERTTSKMTIWRRYRWHGVEKVLKGPVCNTGYTVPLPLPCERPRPLDPLVWSFLTGELGL